MFLKKTFKLIFYLYFFILLNFSFSQSFVNDFIFDLYRFSVTNKSNEENINEYEVPCNLAFIFLNSKIWTFDKGPIPIIDKANSSYMGLTEISYSNFSDFDYTNEYEKVSILINDKNLLEQLESNINKINNIEAEQTSSNIINELNKQIQKTIFTKDDNLLIFYNEEESFFVNNNDSNKSLVSADDKNMVRRFFDSKNRLIKKEFWDLSGGFTSSIIKTKEEYFYNQDELKPNSKIIINDKNKFEVYFNKNGDIIENKQYYPKEIEENKLDYILEKQSFYKYSENRKIIQENVTEYDIEKNITSSFKKVYEYKIEDGMPDYFYYENGVLRIKTIYSAINDYITTFYFDNDNVIESYYKNNIRKKDLFYLQGVLIKEKVYDK